jgi:hypothetical protein
LIQDLLKSGWPHAVNAERVGMRNHDPKSSRRRKATLAVLLGFATTGVLAASAASLGGLSSKNLGADDTVVAACDANGVTVSYTTAYDALLGGYKVTSAVVAGIAPACNNQAISVTLRDGTGASLGTATGTVVSPGPGDGTFAVNYAATVSAKAVVGASVVISG